MIYGRGLTLYDEKTGLTDSLGTGVIANQCKTDYTTVPINNPIGTVVGGAATTTITTNLLSCSHSYNFMRMLWR